MHKLNQVRIPARSQGVVYPYLSPGMPRNRSRHRDFPSLERFTKNPEKGLERASLNNPVRGGMTLLQFRCSSVGIGNESTNEILSEDPWSFTTIRLTEVVRALYLLFLSTHLRDSEEIRIVGSPRSMRTFGLLIFPHPRSSGRVRVVEQI